MRKNSQRTFLSVDFLKSLNEAFSVRSIVSDVVSIEDRMREGNIIVLVLQDLFQAIIKFN